MTNPFSNPSYLLPPLVGAAVFFVLMAIVWQRARRDSPTILFLVFLASMLFWSFSTYLMRSSPDVKQALIWDRYIVVAFLAMFGLYLHFTFTYSRTKANRWVIVILYLSLGIFTGLTLLTDLVVKEMALKPYGYAPIIGPVSYIAFCAGIIFLLGGAYNLLKAYQRSQSYEERNRLLYLAVAAIFPAVGAGLDAFSDLPPVAIWSNLAFSLLCTIAIVRYHLLDIRILIKKSLTYLILSALIAIPYAAVLYIFNLVFEPRGNDWWGHVVTVLILAIILRPLYTESQELVDRLFYRDRYDYLRALERFMREAQNITDLEKLGGTVTELVSGAFHTKTVHLLLSSESEEGFSLVTSLGQKVISNEIVFRNDSPVVDFLKSRPEALTAEKITVDYRLQTLTPKEKRYIEETGAKLFIPMRARQGQLSGILILGEKLSEQPYSGDDMRVLGTLSGQMAMALENARLYRDAVRARENLEVWLNSMNDLVVIVNVDNQIQFMNRAAQERLGSQPGKFCWQIFGQGRICPGCPARQYWGSKRGGLHQDIRIDEKEYDLVSAPLLNPDGSLSVIEVMRDITELKQAEEKLKELYENERGLRQQLEAEIKKRIEFTRALVHELKTPLTPMLSSSELLVEELKEDPWLKLARNIYRGASNLNRTIDELLDIARGELGMLDVHPRPTDALPLLRDVVDEMSPVTTGRGQSLTLEAPPSLPAVEADVNRLRQILLNLLNNASKFTPSGGHINLKVVPQTDKVVIEVQDTGPGISQENQDRLFQPYYRVEYDRQHYSGLGIGLALCKTLIELQNGEIWVKSEVGEGTTFGFYLPLAKMSQKKEEATQKTL